MKPAPFEYHAPVTVEEALALLAEHGWDAKLLAGGQSLIPAMNFRLAQPAVLIDLGRVPELAYVEESDGELRVGAMTRQAVLERDPAVASVPLLQQALPHVAHPQIRSRGTVGGSMAHADPAAELPAVALALGARFRAVGPEGERWIDAADFFLGLLMTALAPDEMLCEVRFPTAGGASGTAFVEMARRHGDYALVGVAATVEVDASGLCSDARVALLSVAEGPWLASPAADVLVGQTPTMDCLSAAADAAAGAIDPPGDIHASADYRRHLTRVLVGRALQQAFSRAAGPVS